MARHPSRRTIAHYIEPSRRPATQNPGLTRPVERATRVSGLTGVSAHQGSAGVTFQGDRQQPATLGTVGQPTLGLQVATITEGDQRDHVRSHLPPDPDRRTRPPRPPLSPPAASGSIIGAALVAAGLVAGSGATYAVTSLIAPTPTAPPSSPALPVTGARAPRRHLRRAAGRQQPRHAPRRHGSQHRARPEHGARGRDPDRLGRALGPDRTSQQRDLSGGTRSCAR